MYVCIIAFNPAVLMSQSPEIIKIPCTGCTPDTIMIRVDRTITANNLECGEYNVSANFTIIQGSSCITDIINKKWYNGWDYIDVRANQTFHLHCGGQIDLKFDVITTCGVSHQTLTWSASPCNNPCEGCKVTFSYCDFYTPLHVNQGDTIPVMPYVYGFHLLTPDGYKYITDTSNFGIFNFPYFMHVSDQCNITPDLYDFVFDFNRFLDIASNGGDSYLYGHVTLIDNFTTNNPAFDCKIYLKFEDMGVYVHNIVYGHRSFDSGSCRYLGYNWAGPYYVFNDPNFQSDWCEYGNFLENMPFSDQGESNIEEQMFVEEPDPEFQNIAIFPTIVSDEFYLYSDKGIYKDYIVKLYNVNGKFIKKFDNNINDYLNISELDSGLYFVIINDIKTGKKHYRKLFKL